jgi:hypothetical protein
MGHLVLIDLHILSHDSVGYYWCWKLRTSNSRAGQFPGILLPLSPSQFSGRLIIQFVLMNVAVTAISSSCPIDSFMILSLWHSSHFPS